MDESFYSGVLLQELGPECRLLSSRAVGGGCINNGVKLTTSSGQYFLKWNTHDTPDLFAKEAHGLGILSEYSRIQVPTVMGEGKYGSRHYLLQSYLETSHPAPGFWVNFGRGLAELHRTTQTAFGLDTDNHIGRLPQKNTWNDNWIDFFIENRLDAQLGLARYKGHIDQALAERFRRLYDQLPGLLSTEPPSLIHGDLWSGNFMVGPEGEACLIDPAIYFANREIELAFTHMFGGFDRSFYQAYFESWPVEPGFDERIPIYNLYPYLVHVNLFGTSYLSGIMHVLNRYC